MAKACGALIGPEGESCGVVGICREHSERISELEAHRVTWRRVAAEAIDLLDRLGAMDIHDASGHTGRYACSWCDAESADPESVPHLHDCRLRGLLDRYLEVK